MWKKWQLVPFFFFFPCRGIIRKKISTVIGIALLLWHATHKTRKWSWLHGVKSKFLKNLLKIYYQVFSIYKFITKNRNFKICTNYISSIIIYISKVWGILSKICRNHTSSILLTCFSHEYNEIFALGHPSMRYRATYNTIEQKSFNGKPLLNKAAYI